MTYTASDDVIDAGFSLHSEFRVYITADSAGVASERNIHAEDRHISVPITHDLAQVFFLHSLHKTPDGVSPGTSTYFVPISIENENVMSVENNTLTPLPVYSGTTKLFDVPARNTIGVPGSSNIPASAFRESVRFAEPRT